MLSAWKPSARLLLSVVAYLYSSSVSVTDRNNDQLYHGIHTLCDQCEHGRVVCRTRQMNCWDKLIRGVDVVIARVFWEDERG